MSENLFLFKPYENHHQHTIVELDPATADKLKQAGDAVEISLGDYNKHRERVKAATAAFERAEQKLKTSDNPIYKNPEVLDYELKKLREEYKKESEEAEKDWKEFRAKQIAEAEVRASRAYIPVTERDKSVAEQAANRFAMQASQVYSADSLYDFIGDLSKDVSRMTDAQKVAMQGQIHRVMSIIESKTAGWSKKPSTSLLNGVYAELQDIRNMDLLSAKAAKSLPLSVDTEYRIKKTVRGW